MTRAINAFGWSIAVLCLVGVTYGCSSTPQSGERTSKVSQPETASNGLFVNGHWQNGLTTNGIITNGLWQNGLYDNGHWQNGLWFNGHWQNGLWDNGHWQNGLFVNGHWQNGLWDNGHWQNGFAADALRSNPYARQLLQYVYQCAMPGSVDPITTLPISPMTYDAELDPNQDPANGPPLTCDPSGESGTPCDEGYTCSAQGLCVIPLHGLIGVGYNEEDGTGWWGSPGNPGTCQESCQRWVTACVLARTNAYGVHVEISMRAPDDAPTAIKTALMTAPDERSTYGLREGAYYGNLFETTPGTLDGSGQFDATTTPQPDGTSASVVVATPSFNACAGPGSNEPEVTARFCSSQGDLSVINVPGTCLPTPTDSTHACTSLSTAPDQSVNDCYPTVDSTQQTPANEYTQVITVYLQQPFATCGNSVCEGGQGGEDDPTKPACSPGVAPPCYCPSDCHPATWAKTFDTTLLDVTIDPYFTPNKIAVGSDGSVVIADLIDDGPPIDIDGDGDPTTNVLTGSTGVDLVVAKYDALGNYLWGVRNQFGIFASSLGGSLTAVDGIAVIDSDPSVVSDTGTAGTVVVAGSNSANSNFLWVAKFASADGTLVSGWPVTLGGKAEVFALHLATDAAGDVGLAGNYNGTATLGSTILALSTSSQPGVLVTKVWADGASHKDCPVAGPVPCPVAWAIAEPGDDAALAFDPNGKVAVTTVGGPKGLSTDALYKFDANGKPLWTSPVNYDSLPSSDPTSGLVPRAVTTDPSGNLYVSGSLGTSVAFQDLFVVKYGSDDTFGPGTYKWSTGVRSTCPNDGNTCSGAPGDSAGQYLNIDANNNVIVGGLFQNTVDFGAGVFDAYAESHVFIAAYSPADVLSPGQSRFQWAKHVPIILDGTLSGFAVDPNDHILLGGNYSGSMQIDDLLLVNTIPEVTNHRNMFLGRFGEPQPDTTPPVIGVVTQSYVIQATGPDGAEAWYMPPTAIDTGYAGVDVSCYPPPGTVLQRGTHDVHCVATDPAGNAAAADFDVTVVDTIPPVFESFSPPSPVQATGVNGANVTFSAPLATDQVAGIVTSVCTLASGTPVSATSTFPVGTTPVTCTATDEAGNQSQMQFSVTVTPPPVTVACVGAPGAPQVVPTAPGTCGDPVSNASGSAGVCSSIGSALASCTYGGQASETLGPGTYTIPVVATSIYGTTATCTSYVTVADEQVPAIQCPAETVECTGNGGATVTPAATCTDNCSCTTSCPATGVYALGAAQVTCSAVDPSGNAASCQESIAVRDTTPPHVTLAPSPSLWSPNYRAVAFDVSQAIKSVADACSGALSPDSYTRIVSIYSDEVDPGSIVIKSATTFTVAASRNGNGNGRVYGVTLDVHDPSGNTTRVLWKITVPHDQTGASAVDDGPGGGFTVTSTF